MSTETVDVVPQLARPRVILPRGYQGAGKTELFRELRAEDPNLVRVSRDDLRAQLFGEHGRLTFAQEETVTKAERAQAHSLIEAGHSVYVDALNLRARWARGWADFAALHGADLQVIDLDTDVDECVRRDRARGEAGGRTVGEATIRETAKRFPRKTWPIIEPSPGLFFRPEPYVPDESLPPAWVSDLDGTVAQHGDRSPYDFTRVHEDKPIAHTVAVLRKLAADSSIIMLSGRGEECRDVTEEWLRANDIPFNELHMRGRGDTRPDFLVKSLLFDAHLRHRYRVLGMFDDRLSVVRMWHRLGIPLMRLGAPDRDDF